jgi:hypothetical protein
LHSSKALLHLLTGVSLGFSSVCYTDNTHTHTHIDIGIEMKEKENVREIYLVYRDLEYFSWAGFESQSFQPLPPE